MNKHIGAEDVMAFPSMPKWKQKETQKVPRKRFWMFRVGLVLYDFLFIYYSFRLAGWILGPLDIGNMEWATGLWPVLPSLLVISFFPSHNLYSYHLIFFRKKHFTQLQIAIGWGGFAVLCIIGQYALPVVWGSDPKTFLIVIIACLCGSYWIVRWLRQPVHCLLRALGTSLIAVWLIQQFFQGQVTLSFRDSWVAVLGFALSSVSLTAGRYFIVENLFNGWLMRTFRRQVGIIGNNKEAEKIVSHVIDNNAPFWIAGTIGIHRSLNTTVPKHCLGDIIEIPALCSENRISDIIITDESLDKRTLISLLDFAISRGITVWFPPSVLPIIDRKIYIDNFCGIPMIRMCQQRRFVFYDRFKYALDASITLPLMAIFLPLFGIIAAAIKMNSPGPVFYRANAIGKNGIGFKMFKFRSMKMNNDASIHKQFVTKLIKGEIGQEQNSDKPLKITDDPRVTSVGKFLRKYSLDELPQVFNVLLGQMSLIGPRPCLPYEFDVYQDWYKKRAVIRPGMTGLWQVAGRSEVSFEEMILLDLYYVYNRNIWMDINILIETVFVVLAKKGAY